ncbi:hypothetical protein GCM10027436_73420 [Actinophytocola sediminis]
MPAPPPAELFLQPPGALTQRRRAAVEHVVEQVVEHVPHARQSPVVSLHRNGHHGLTGNHTHRQLPTFDTTTTSIEFGSPERTLETTNE